MTVAKPTFFGGAQYVTTSTDATFHPGLGTHVIVENEGGSPIDFYLPEANRDEVRLGERYVIVCQTDSTANVDVVDADGTSILGAGGPLEPDDAITLYCVEGDDAAGTWVHRRDIAGLIPNPPDAETWYMLCGGNTTGALEVETEEYDAQADSWTQKSDAPARFRRAATFSTGPVAFICGGPVTPAGKIASYDPDTWTSHTAYGSAMSDVCASYVNSVGIVGSLDANPPFGSHTRVVQYSLPPTDSWTLKTSQPAQAREQTAKPTDPYHRQFGGHLNNLQTYNWRYDAVGDSWSSLTSIPSPGRGWAPSMQDDSDDSIYLVGGHNNTPLTSDIDDVDAYDVSGDSWSAKTDFHLGNRQYMTGGDASGTGYITAGTSSTNTTSHSGYDFSGDSWSTLDTLIVGKLQCTNCGGAITA